MSAILRTWFLEPLKFVESQIAQIDAQWVCNNCFWAVVWNLYLEGLSKVRQLGQAETENQTFAVLTWSTHLHLYSWEAARATDHYLCSKHCILPNLRQASKDLVKHHWNFWGDSGGIPAPALLHDLPKMGFPPKKRVSFLQIIQFLHASPINQKNTALRFETA